MYLWAFRVYKKVPGENACRTQAALVNYLYLRKDMGQASDQDIIYWLKELKEDARSPRKWYDENADSGPKTFGGSCLSLHR